MNQSQQPPVIMAEFTAEAEILGRVVPTDWEVSYPVTGEVLALGKKQALAVADGDGQADQLKEAEAAPQWVKDWPGPFQLRVADAIAAFYKVDAPG